LRVAPDRRVQTHLDKHIFKHCEVFINRLPRKFLFAQLAQAPRKLAAGFKEDHLEALGDQVKGRRQPAQSAPDHRNASALPG